jgi:hypothetical protein
MCLMNVNASLVATSLTAYYLWQKLCSLEMIETIDMALEHVTRYSFERGDSWCGNHGVPCGNE